MFMRYIVGFVMLFWLVYINTCQAFEVTCFSAKTRIYHGWGHNLVVSDGYIMFVEDATKAVIMTTSDCVILEPLTWESKRKLLA